MAHTRPTPRLVGTVPPGTDPVVVLLPGGEVSGHGRPGLLPYLRMVPFAHALRRLGVGTYLLKYRFSGWNGADHDPVRDIEWALDRIRPRPVILVGHSMGGRAALWGGGDPLVVGVCALAPWIETADPWAHLESKPVLIVHGVHDHITSPVRSLALARRLHARFEHIDDGHPMLLRPARWKALVVDFARGIRARS